jgi:hypothetical protein
VLVFDVNETLLDLGALDPHFERVFGDAAVRREWFATMLQSALLLTVTGPVLRFRLALPGRPRTDGREARRHRVRGG